MHSSFLVIPLITFVVAVSGSFLSNVGLAAWYQTLTLPSWTPSGAFIGMMWSIIYILTTISAIWIWNLHKKPKNLKIIAVAFLINAVLNVFWSYLFFVTHLLWAATWEAALLGLSVLVLIWLIWPIKKFAAVLLFPYFGWVCFATYVSLRVAQLNS